jgi:hypothetical protein
VLAYGDGTVLSHASAAAAWDLRGSASSAIDVTWDPEQVTRRREYVADALLRALDYEFASRSDAKS